VTAHSEAAPRKKKKRGGLLDATVFAIVGMIILTGLGIWQLDRRAWKENVIQKITARLAAEPEGLPPRASWSTLRQATDEYRRVIFNAELIPGEEALVYTAGSAFRPDVTEPGYWVFAPARLAGGSIVVVNRGFVPANRKDPATRPGGAPGGIIDIVGMMRWPESRGLFTPNDEPQKNIWFVRDPKAIADAKKWATIAPFYIDMESPQPAGGLPRPGKVELRLPNNHLQYAITWFGLALALAGVFLVWATRRLLGRG
jgi:surfeit locus 1 family protein